MARNRKRAKERRSRRPASAQVARPGVATAGGQRNVEPDRELIDPELEPEGPLAQAAPDVELADAQLALGRPDLARDDGDASEVGGDASEAEEYEDAQEYDDELEPEAADDGRDGSTATGRRELATHGAAAPAPRPGLIHRLISFLQGSWRELQRVQWPDRRQVVQATGVVIGFVIVAGVYLGVADTLATRLMNFILK